MRTTRLASLCLIGALAACSGGSGGSGGSGPPGTISKEAASGVSVTSGHTRSTGSRPYLVETMSELAARADAVVVGTKSGAPHTEPADAGGDSGLTMTTTPFEVSRWIKGQGPVSLPLSELDLMEGSHEVARIRPGQEYVLFLEKVEHGSEARYVLVGGVGAYEMRDDGRLARVDESADGFPQDYPTLAALVTDVRSAPTTWTRTP